MRLAGLALLALVGGCTGKYVRPTTPERIAATPELIARGNYLVNSVTQCGTCHTPRVGDSWLGGERTDAYLAGGELFDDRANGLRVAAPNVSQDRETGIGAWSDDEIMRAIRDGVARDGHLLWPPMGFTAWQYMSDEDVRAIVAYLRTTPAIPNRVDRSNNQFPFMGRVAMKLGAIHHAPARDVRAPAPSDRAAYGLYLARLGLCTDCHNLTSTGPDDDFMLGGSKRALAEADFGEVYARNLTPDPKTGLGRYTAEQIKQALKSGRRLDGKMMAPPMSLLIPHLSTWTEEDLDALVAFMKSVKPIEHATPEPNLTAGAKRLVAQ